MPSLKTRIKSKAVQSQKPPRSRFCEDIEHTSFHHSLKPVGDENTCSGLPLELTIDVIHQLNLRMGIQGRCLRVGEA